MKYYTCPACNHYFQEIDAHCEDYRVAQRSFGCPDCLIFLQRLDNKVVDTKKLWISYAATVLIACGVVVWSAYHQDVLISLRIPTFTPLLLGVILSSAGYPFWKTVFTTTSGPDCEVFESSVQ